MTQEMGKILTETRGDVQEAIDMAYYMGGEGRRMLGYTAPVEMPNKFDTLRERLRAQGCNMTCLAQWKSRDMSCPMQTWMIYRKTKPPVIVVVCLYSDGGFALFLDSGKTKSTKIFPRSWSIENAKGNLHSLSRPY